MKVLRETFELVVQCGSECEVVDKDDARRVHLLLVGWVEEVAPHNLVLPVLFTPPAHPPPKVPVHILLESNKTRRQWNKKKGTESCKSCVYLCVAARAFRLFDAPGHFTRRAGRNLKDHLTHTGTQVDERVFLCHVDVIDHLAHEVIRSLSVNLLKKGFRIRIYVVLSRASNVFPILQERRVRID